MTSPRYRDGQRKTSWMLPLLRDRKDENSTPEPTIMSRNCKNIGSIDSSGVNYFSGNQIRNWFSAQQQLPDAQRKGLRKR